MKHNMNHNTKIYKEIETLINDANQLLIPVRGIDTSKDYDEMFKRLSHIIEKTISIITRLKDVMTLNDDEASSFLFNRSIDESDFGSKKQLSRALLYAMLKMMEEIKQVVKLENAKRYEILAREIVTDITPYFNLYCETHWEKCDLKNYIKFPTHMLRRPTLKLHDQREVIRSLFFLESVPSIEHLSIRDIRPHVLILIRQSLETLFNGLIGFTGIVDLKGEPLKRFTQIGIKFLSNYRNKRDPSGCSVSGDGWNMEFKMPIMTLERLNSWCNGFTHNPYINSLPIIYFAYDQYERFTYGKMDIPDVTITNVQAMRSEFECFVSKQNPKAVVQWKNETIHGSSTIEMRRRAIRKNLNNLWKAIIEEVGSYYLLHPNILIRRVASKILKKK